MRIGMATSLSAANAEEWATQIEQLGCRSIVFPLDYRANENDIADYTDEARKHDLTIAEVGIWKNVLSADKDKRDEARRYAVGQLRLADEIGARCCVNIAGTYGGPIWDGGYKENFGNECWNTIVDYTKELIDEVKPKHTKYSIEPMPWMYPTGPDEYLKLMKDVDREEFAIHLDLVNMINCPQRYFFSDEFMEECFDKLGPFIRSCHVKDIKLVDKLTFQLVETFCGNGTLNIEKYCALMNKYDPDMPVIIEHLTTDKEYIESYKYISKRLKSANIC